MKKRIKKLTVEKLNRQINNKKDLSLKLLKGIKNCQNKPNLINAHISQIFNNKKKKFLNILQKNRCQITGRAKACINFFGLSKHVIKKKRCIRYITKF